MNPRYREDFEEILQQLGCKYTIGKTWTSDGIYRETKEKVECFCAGEAIDTTAAGDTFCGATCVKLAEGAPLKTAMEFAAVCSGIAVTRRGAQISVPTRAEADPRSQKRARVIFVIVTFQSG